MLPKQVHGTRILCFVHLESLHKKEAKTIQRGLFARIDSATVNNDSMLMISLAIIVRFLYRKDNIIGHKMFVILQSHKRKHTTVVLNFPPQLLKLDCMKADALGKTGVIQSISLESKLDSRCKATS